MESHGAVPANESLSRLLLNPDRQAFWASTAVDARLKIGQLPIGIITDIDWTYMLPSDPYEEEHKSTHLLTQYLEEQGYPTVAATGRDITMMQRDHDLGILPIFKVVIAAVGSERYVSKDGRYVRDEGYVQFIEEELGFKRDVVYAACLDFWHQVQNAGDSADLDFQPRDRQNNVLYWQNHPDAKTAANPEALAPQPYKISFNYFGDEAVTARLKEHLRQILDDAELPHISIVCSVDPKAREDGRIFNNLDVIPIEKSAAISQLTAELNHFYDKRLWLFAGDSMNDADALLGSVDASILVGGAQDELLRLIDHKPREAYSNNFSKWPDGRLVYLEHDPNRLGPRSLLRAVKSFEEIHRSPPE